MVRAAIHRDADRLALAQGVVYLVSGVWPLVHMRSFEAVTGPKTDRWLVKTVGTLVTAIGGGLVLAGRRRRTTPEVALIGAGSALGLAAIDVVYVAKGRISPVYLLDAAIELPLAAAWAGVWRTTAARGDQSESGGRPCGEGGISR